MAKPPAPTSALHLWLTKGEVGNELHDLVRLRVDKTQIATTMTKYQLDPSQLTAHISLGNNPGELDTVHRSSGTKRLRPAHQAMGTHPRSSTGRASSAWRGVCISRSSGCGGTCTPCSSLLPLPTRVIVSRSLVPYVRIIVVPALAVDREELGVTTWCAGRCCHLNLLTGVVDAQLGFINQRVPRRGNVDGLVNAVVGGVCANVDEGACCAAPIQNSPQFGRSRAGRSRYPIAACPVAAGTALINLLPVFGSMVLVPDGWPLTASAQVQLTGGCREVAGSA